MARALADLPDPGAVLFDLDGTLVDTVAARITAWQEALGEADLYTDRELLAPLIGLDGKRLATEIAAEAGRPIDERRAEAIDRRSGEIYSRINRSPRPLPGVARLVAELERRAMPWAIATSSGKDQVTASVAALRLSTEPVIVDASHVEHAKPEPDLLLAAASQLRIEPTRCWYVGDSTWDMVSAVAAGMIAIGVTSGSAVDSHALESAGAAAVARTLSDIADALERREGAT